MLDAGGFELLAIKLFGIKYITKHHGLAIINLSRFFAIHQESRTLLLQNACIEDVIHKLGSREGLAASGTIHRLSRIRILLVSLVRVIMTYHVLRRTIFAFFRCQLHCLLDTLFKPAFLRLEIHQMLLGF